MKKKIILLVNFFALLCSLVQAQNASATYISPTAQPDGQFTVCGAPQRMTMRIDNGNSSAMTGITFTLHIPPGGTYVPGSVTVANEAGITDLNNPKFSIANIASSNFVDFTYQIQFGCAVIPFQNGGGLTKETVDIKYNGTTIQNGISPSSTYNVIAASLSIISATNTNFTGNVGNSYAQSMTIRNGGLGCTTTGFLKLDRAGGTFSFSSPSIGTLKNDTLFFNAANMPGGDGQWCSGEDLTVSYNVIINNCTNLNRAAVAGWGCYGSSCQNSTARNSNVIITNGVPNLTISMPTQNLNYCMRGEGLTQRIRIINSGNGVATNFIYGLANAQSGCCVGPTAFDSLWVMKDKFGNIMGNFSTTKFNYAPWGYWNNGGFGGTGCAHNKFHSIEMRFNGTIPANDTVYLETTVYSADVSCLNCVVDYMPWIIIGQQFSYQNQCANSSYDNGGIYGNLFRTGWPRQQWSQNIPADVACTQGFNIELNYSSLYTSTKNNTVGRGYIAVKLGTGFVQNGAYNFTSGLSPVVTNTSFMSNDTLFIKLNPNAGGAGQLRIPVKPAGCSSAACGLQNISVSHLIWWDSTCINTRPLKMNCANATVDVKCPNPCPPGGATPLNFTFERINFGQADNDNNSIADLSGGIDISKIAVKSAVNGDTILGTWNIKVYPNADPSDPRVGQPFTNTYIDFEMGNFWQTRAMQNDCGMNAGANGLVTALPNAEVLIYPSGGGTVISCTVSPSIQGTKAHYDFSSCKAAWNGGDSMVVKAKYLTNWPTWFNSNVPQQLFVTSNHIYSTYAPQATPTTAPIAQSTYTCDGFNSNLTILQVSIGDNAIQSVFNGCNSYLDIAQAVFTVDNGGNSKFPYEVRNFGIIDTVRIRLPQGFDYLPNTTVMYATAFSPGSGNVPIPDSKVIISGNVLKIVNIKSFYKQYGGTLDPTDESKIWYFRLYLQPNCDAVSGSIINYNVKSTWAGNGVNTPLVWKYSPNGQISGCAAIPSDSAAVPLQSTYNGPRPVFTGGGTQVTNTGAASWSVQLQNQSNSIAAPSSYFYFAPTNSLSNIIVREQPGNVVVAPDANGFYQLSNLNASSSRNFTVTADLGKCSIDSVKMNYGWGCTGYPTTFTALPCTQFTWLKASGYPAALDATFDALLTGSLSTVPACSPFEVEVVINSNLIGNLDNEMYKVILPAGLTYVPNSVQVVFPVGGSYVANAYNPTIVPAATGDTIAFAVNSVTSGAGLTGVGDLTKNQVKIKYQLQSNCGYISGSILKTRIGGSSVCGDKIATVVKTSSAMKLTGANASSQFSITYRSPDTLKTCGTAKTVTVVVKNTGTAPAVVNDSLNINLSNGMQYMAGSFVSVRNAPSASTPVINGNILKWQIPSTVAPGDSMKFTIDVAASKAGCGSNTVDLYTTQSIVLSCGAGTCNTPVITGRLISNPIITVCCPCITPKITNVSVTPPTCNGMTVNSNAAVSVTGITDGLKYSYGTNGTTGLFFSNATTLSGSTISLTSLPNPSVPKTYTFRIYAYPLDSTCYNDTIVILNPTNPNFMPTFNAVAPICSGTILSALPTTSTNGVTGTWSPALNNTTTTTYTFTPTTGFCAATTTLTITVNPLPSFSLAQTNVTCFGSGNGKITTTTTSGTAPFTYSINDGATFPNTTGIFDNLVPATYKIAVKDTNGCVRKCN